MLACLDVSIVTVFGYTITLPSYESDVNIFTNASFFIEFFSIVIVVPIMEELMFRGVILNRLLVNVPKWLAILISSILFGLMHMSDSLRMLSIAISSIWLALLYIRFRNLWLCIIVHMVNNFIATNVTILTFVNSTASSFPVLSIVLPIIYMLGIGTLLVLKCPPAIFEKKLLEDNCPTESKNWTPQNWGT